MAAEIASDESIVIESPRPGDGVLTALYEQHYDHLLRLASLISAGIDAEDLVQETYVRALRRWDSQRPIEAFPAWAHTTMVRIHLNHLRRAFVERRARRLLGTDDYFDPPASTSDTFAALKTITPRQRVAIVLRYYEDLSENEIAERMSCRVGTVKALLSQGRARLKTVLGVEI